MYILHAIWQHQQVYSVEFSMTLQGTFVQSVQNSVNVEHAVLMAEGEAKQSVWHKDRYHKSKLNSTEQITFKAL